jgi:hypothetical protein
MFRLDHFVVHIDDDFEMLRSLKDQIEPLGFPFDPSRGKGTKGFKVANIWIGNQYLELPYIKTRDGGGWRKEWVEKYNQGKRGIFGLCIMTDQLDHFRKEVIARGIPASAPERITYKMFFGLFKKSLPFRLVFTPQIPGTDLQIFFLEMDSQEKLDFMKKYFMKPNSRDYGITGIHEAIVKSHFTTDAWEYIEKLFPNLIGNQTRATLDMGETKLTFEQSQHADLRVELRASTKENLKKGSFMIENVEVVVQ